MSRARVPIPVLSVVASIVAASARAAPPLTADDFAPVFDDARVTRALDRLAGGDAAGARERLLAIGQDGKPVAHLERVRFLLGLACVRSQDWLGAVAVLDRLDEAVPAVADRVLLLRGQALAGLGRNDEAVEALARVPRSSAVGVAALRARGDALVAAGRNADAAAAFGDLVAAGRKDPETVGKLAAALLAAGRRDEAIQLLRRAYFESPGPGRTAYRRVLSDLGASPET
ncbi:MAG: tetratricopeptide repeat protein, partial [Deltaproteobacteria bacterium]|nr:tetratricopeptide repeat protein [Deltaproteobacteria bacterium]